MKTLRFLLALGFASLLGAGFAQAEAKKADACCSCSKECKACDAEKKTCCCKGEKKCEKAEEKKS